MEKEHYNETEHSQCSAGTSGPQIMSRMALNDNKAGMEGLDKDRINQIIYEASKDSKFFENERKKEEQLEMRIKEQQSKMSKVTPGELRDAELEADKVLAMVEDERDLSHTIVHVDMDAFYAAVEMRDDPTLLNKPMAVGGMGMLSTSNYLARRYGVRAAMPGFIGLKLCPSLVIVKPNFEKYHAVSREIRDVMSQYDPDFCPMSLDEAYLDLTNHMQQRLHSLPLDRMFLLRQERLEFSGNLDMRKKFCTCDLNSVLRPTLIGLPEFQDHGLSDDSLETLISSQRSVSHSAVCDICKKPFPSYEFKLYRRGVDDAVLELRNRIEQRTQLTASAGIAPNTMLAKVCSDKNKPNGQYRIKPDKTELLNFIRDLPIRKISGIGKVTEKLLGSLGVETCKDLFKHRAMLYHLFSPTSFQHFMRITAGIGSTCVERHSERKSISTETTFSEISDPKQLFQKCQDLCQNLAEDMKEERLLGKTLTLKIKTVSFEVKTRSYTLAHFTNDEASILKAAQMLLQTEIDAAPPGFLQLRLMGVRMSKLCAEKDGQVSVIDMFKKMNRKVEGTQKYTDFSSPGSHNFLRGELLHARFDDGTSSDERLPYDVEDSDDDGCAEFRFPLEQTLAPNLKNSQIDVTKNLNKQEKQCPGIQGKVKKGSSAGIGDNAGMLKFVNKLHNVSDVSLQTKERDGDANFEQESQSKAGTSKNMPLPSSNTIHLQEKLCVSQDISEKSIGQFNEFTHSFKTSQVNNSLGFKNQLPLSPQLSNYESSLGQQETGMISCPICKQQKLNWPLDQLNTHIDLCLSKQAVKDILQQEKLKEPASTKSKDKTTKRLAANDDQLHNDKRPKSQPSVISYFKSYNI